MTGQVDLKALPTPEQRKQAFQDYMNKHGVIAAINHAVVAMYDEGLLPEHPQHYLAQRLAPHLQTRAEAAEQQLASAQAELQLLRSGSSANPGGAS
mmetsp:Transcript_69645/g.220526  ORF Transcript_69645/g.220526 Transcript_69645/m.220526 type:complete len:96 (-) Transcript_69645:316-603(-)